MPQVKQPAPLQAIAMDTLLEFVVQFYDRLGATGSLDEFRKGISVIKTKLCNRIPWYYLAEFCTRFLEKFLSKKRNKAQNKAALEIIMDTKIVGLRCRGRIFQFLSSQDRHRFLEPVELDLTCLVNGFLSTSLENYHLNDLTTFIYPRYCSDFELAVIGDNCLKLQVLKVQNTDVTDEGMQLLHRCSKLRIIDISLCVKVSYIGINHLLCTHEELEELSFGSHNDFDKSRRGKSETILSRLDSAAVCPSMKSLWIHEASISDRNLRSIVSKFPNLTSFAMEDSVVADLAILASSNKLEAIELSFPDVDVWYHICSTSDIEETWQRLQQLLSHIGTNIKTLKFQCWDQDFSWYQRGLDFIFHSCPHIEHLKFDHRYGILVIPQFKNLKELILTVSINFESSDNIGPPVIKFDKLINLESLTIIDFGVTFESVKSMMLDDVKFPKLKELNTDCLTDDEVRVIEYLAKTNNIDFKLTNTGTIS